MVLNLKNDISRRRRNNPKLHPRFHQFLTFAPMGLLCTVLWYECSFQPTGNAADQHSLTSSLPSRTDPTPVSSTLKAARHEPSSPMPDNASSLPTTGPTGLAGTKPYRKKRLSICQRRSSNIGLREMEPHRLPGPAKGPMLDLTSQSHRPRRVRLASWSSGCNDGRHAYVCGVWQSVVEAKNALEYVMKELALRNAQLTDLTSDCTLERCDLRPPPQSLLNQGAVWRACLMTIIP